MRLRHKKLADQVIVITGASSGIGLVTARMAAKRGARVVAAARAEDALRQLVEEIRAGGGEAIYVAADVGRPEDVERIKEEAVRHFGGFDTWVNNAGVSIYGNMLAVPYEDMRRLFETNFWGVVYGSLAAARHLRGRGGSIINVGSTLSDRAVPVQGIYSASKHAVKGFTDALRMELEAEGAPVSVTLVKPAGIDTPYTRHAKNYMGREPGIPPPVYAPETVAEAILHSAETGQRDIFVGGGGKALSVAEQYAPRLTDRMMEAAFFDMQQQDEPARPHPNNGIDGPSGTLEERGGEARYVSESSIYTKATLHPYATAAVLFGAGLALSLLLYPPRDGKLRRRDK